MYWLRYYALFNDSFTYYEKTYHPSNARRNWHLPICWGLGWASIDQIEDYIQYRILITDDANFKEIHEKYEILEVKGEIYEVKEIEVND